MVGAPRTPAIRQLKSERRMPIRRTRQPRDFMKMNLLATCTFGWIVYPVHRTRISCLRGLLRRYDYWGITPCSTSRKSCSWTDPRPEHANSILRDENFVPLPTSSCSKTRYTSSHFQPAILRASDWQFHPIVCLFKPSVISNTPR